MKFKPATLSLLFGPGAIPIQSLWRAARVVLALAISSLLCASLSAGDFAFTIDGASQGRIFEGIGALSAGASSRLLLDYPEPQRGEILDFLFKPGFGANLHHLKVEIGGDVDSTDGSEPSHAATREEFLHPRPEYFQRGYEWWLMKEAKRRHPAILLEGLQWGAPGWVGEGRFYSQDNADFIAAFIQGAKRYHGLDMDFQGIWNETLYSADWIQLLRRTLDDNGLQRVGIDAGDLWKPEEKWRIAEDMARDPALSHTIAAVNAHTTHMNNFCVPPAARDLGKPLWDGEAHAYGGDWYAAANHIRFYLRAYPLGRITKVISWSLITAYHDFLTCPGSGMMMANEPWSGYYEVQPPLWMIAHVNQFATPGWRYLDQACRVWQDEGALREGFSIVSLRAPEGNDYSVLIETMDSKETHRGRFHVKGGLSNRDLACWRSVFGGETFVRQADVPVRNNEFTLELRPNCVYSLTTTRGQGKGAPAGPMSKSAPFPLPFTARFDHDQTNQPGRFFSDVHGTFLVTERSDHQGRCLSQTTPRQGIPWGSCAFSPQTIVGDVQWQDYRAEVDVQLPGTGQVILWTRATLSGNPKKFLLPGLAPKFQGYALVMDANGDWILHSPEQALAQGHVTAPGTAWHRLGLAVRRAELCATWDGQPLAQAQNTKLTHGVVALGTGWNGANFDRLDVTPW
jgi:galactosylceramidase